MNQRAGTFRKLHAPGELLILPNAWDAGSARVIESCGAAAIATSSAAVAWSLGYPDGNALPPPMLTRTIEAIVRVIDVGLERERLVDEDVLSANGRGSFRGLK